MEDWRSLDEEVTKLRNSLGRLPEPLARPFLVMVAGLPGTGKSYFCDKLSERVPLVILESDNLRRVLSPNPTYSQAESAHLFQAIHQLIKLLLTEGVPVVLDATNLSERHREHLYSIADRLDAKLVIVLMRAHAAVVRQRLEERAGAAERRDSSDADWTVYQKLRPTMEKIQRDHFVVDTSKDIGPVLDKITRELER